MTAFRGRAVLPALAFLASACVTEPESALPEGAQQVQASPAYVTWWAATEQCARLDGDLGRIEWYVVPGATTFQTDQGEKVGLRIQQGGRIQIVLAEAYANHEMVVRHEMLHALLGQPGHPEEYFEQRCGLTWQTWQAAHPAEGEATSPGLS